MAEVLYAQQGAVSNGTTAVQTVTVSGSPTGGSYRLNYGNVATARIQKAATAAQFEAALEALSQIGPGNVTVTGAAGGPYTVTGAGDLARGPMELLRIAGNFLTGGTNPTVTSVMTTPGVAPTGDGEIPAGAVVADANGLHQNIGTEAAPSFQGLAAGLYYVETALTNAQLLTLKATPVTLLPSPGAGYAWHVLFTHQAYAGPGSLVGAHSVDIQYGTTGNSAGGGLYASSLAGSWAGLAPAGKMSSGGQEEAAATAVVLLNTGAAEYTVGNAANVLTVGVLAQRVKA